MMLEFYNDWLKTEDGFIRRQTITGVFFNVRYKTKMGTTLSTIKIIYNNDFHTVDYYDNEESKKDYDSLIEWLGCKKGSWKSMIPRDCSCGYKGLAIVEVGKNPIIGTVYRVKCNCGKRTHYYSEIENAIKEWNEETRLEVKNDQIL